MIIFLVFQLECFQAAVTEQSKSDFLNNMHNILFHLKSRLRKECLLGGLFRGFNNTIKFPSFTGFVFRLAWFQVLHIDFTMFTERRETVSFLSLFKNENKLPGKPHISSYQPGLGQCPPLSQSQAKEMRLPNLVQTHPDLVLQEAGTSPKPKALSALAAKGIMREAIPVAGRSSGRYLALCIKILESLHCL